MLCYRRSASSGVHAERRSSGARMAEKMCVGCSEARRQRGSGVRWRMGEQGDGL
ncbi:pollen-specific leucine-rich repeat extensin-like protein 4 [Iris pallida]|uniref:Pollen-specific leucine-rich repeat extensin-like protein 4 n=1 Tax=Iris pallida TaxID=29817 RepID=A0AAX6FY37_IRIPA|nr:pollen-specific leucine-rich repeat extensin-like protein 4 [Iris pallida]